MTSGHFGGGGGGGGGRHVPLLPTPGSGPERVNKETFLPSNNEIGPKVSDKKIFKVYYIYTWGKKKRKFKFLNIESLFVNKLI